MSYLVAAYTVVLSSVALYWVRVASERRRLLRDDDSPPNTAR